MGKKSTINKKLIKRNPFLLYSAATAAALGIFILAFFIWVLVDRSDFSGAFPVVMYIFIGTISVELAILSGLSAIHAKENKEVLTHKYIVLAFFTSFIFIGQWIYLFIYRESGIKTRKISDTLYLYYASKIDKLLTDDKYVNALNDQDKDQVEILLEFKKTGVVKKYEANFYISRILTRAGVLNDVPLVREEIQIISSNLI